MPAPISVILPTLNAAERLPLCLAGLMEGVEAGLIAELIVVDAGSTDGTGASGQDAFREPQGGLVPAVL